MRSAAVIHGPWLGSYPETVADAGEARDDRTWRTLRAPFWSQRLTLRRGQAFVADVLVQEHELRGASDAGLEGRVREVRRGFAQRGLEDSLCACSVALARE